MVVHWGIKWLTGVCGGSVEKFTGSAERCDGSVREMLDQLGIRWLSQGMWWLNQEMCWLSEGNVGSVGNLVTQSGNVVAQWRGLVARSRDVWWLSVDCRGSVSWVGEMWWLGETVLWVSRPMCHTRLQTKLSRVRIWFPSQSTVGIQEKLPSIINTVLYSKSLDWRRP
jgi:hypothetical protein